MARMLSMLDGNDRGSSSMSSPFSGIPSMLFVAAAMISIMAIVILNCGQRRKKPKPSNNVVYYGSGGVPRSGGTSSGVATKSSAGVGLAVGVGAGVGIAAAVIATDGIASAVDSVGGGGNGDGGASGGGCGGGGCGAMQQRVRMSSTDIRQHVVKRRAASEAGPSRPSKRHRASASVGASASVVEPDAPSTSVPKPVLALSAPIVLSAAPSEERTARGLLKQHR
uniref:Glycine-rich protein 1 n=1 Tax=Elaeis guineensis var. tenera TaxID=51953 RepID=A0A6J0PER2_ELAGV|nr:glycine-rich protein 1 [Elaeis guineensis]